MRKFRLRSATTASSATDAATIPVANAATTAASTGTGQLRATTASSATRLRSATGNRPTSSTADYHRGAGQVRAATSAELRRPTTTSIWRSSTGVPGAPNDAAVPVPHNPTTSDAATVPDAHFPTDAANCKSIC